MDAIGFVYLFAVIAAVIFIGFLALARSAGKHFRLLSEQIAYGPPEADIYFSEDQTEQLPLPVRRYFREVLRDGQRYPKTVALKHNGYFKTSLDARWTPIDGEEIFSARHPAFAWSGKTKWFTAVDSFVGGKGQLRVNLLNAFKVAEFTGKKVDHSELLRWLAESAWFPTALLCDKHVRWIGRSDSSAVLEYNWNEFSLSAVVYFSADNKMARMEAKRYQGNGELQHWVGHYSDYREYDGILLPTRIEACWNIDGEKPYARFLLKEIIFR